MTLGKTVESLSFFKQNPDAMNRESVRISHVEMDGEGFCCLVLEDGRAIDGLMRLDMPSMNPRSNEIVYVVADIMLRGENQESGTDK